jgi:hypothetical protein
VQTSVQLFRYDQQLTACALGEPSLTLVRNDSEFGLLISCGAHEDSFTSRFYLDEVSYLRVTGRQWAYTDFDSVAIFQHAGIWLAQDTGSGRYFPNPSHRPYHVVLFRTPSSSVSGTGAPRVLRFQCSSWRNNISDDCLAFQSIARAWTRPTIMPTEAMRFQFQSMCSQPKTPPLARRPHENSFHHSDSQRGCSAGVFTFQLLAQRQNGIGAWLDDTHVRIRWAISGNSDFCRYPLSCSSPIVTVRPTRVD